MGAWVKCCRSTFAILNSGHTPAPLLHLFIAAFLVPNMPALPAPAQVDPACLASLGLGEAVLTRSRTNGFANMLEAMKKRARMATADLPRFPSLVISREGLAPQGSFAEAQVGGRVCWGVLGGAHVCAWGRMAAAGYAGGAGIAGSFAEAQFWGGGA